MSDSVKFAKREGEVVFGEKPKLKQVTEHDIKVNEPLKFDNFSLYQVDFKQNELDQMVFQLIRKDTEKSFGTVKINLLEPKSEYDLGSGYKVKVMSYLVWPFIASLVVISLSLIPYWNSAVIDQVNLSDIALTGHDGILVTVWLGTSIMVFS